MFTLESLGKKMHSFTERDYTLLLLHQLSSSLILPYLPWNQLRYFFLCNTIINNKYFKTRWVICLKTIFLIQVRIQTSPVGTFPTTLRGAMPKIYAAEGMNGFYKSLPPLWGRQIPYTMMKFACFERTVELLYQYVVPKPRAECSKGEQLVVTFAAGYIAGGNILN